MWKGLYNHAQKSTPPRQSTADFLSAVREESQQLEEELTNHQEVPPGGTAHHHYPGSRQGIQHTPPSFYINFWKSQCIKQNINKQFKSKTLNLDLNIFEIANTI